MKLARTIRFDESDVNVFERAAEPGEWAVSGAFTFSDLTEADLTGKTRQAFANGWLGLSSFGRATFVAVAEITEAEYAQAIDALAAHFCARFGAPSLEAARPVAAEELAYMAELCGEQDANTLLTVSRSLVDAGVSEAFRTIRPAEASVDMVAVHVTPD